MLWANRRTAARKLKASARAVRKLPPQDAQAVLEVLLRSLATEVLADDAVPVERLAETVANLVKALRDHEAIVAAFAGLRAAGPDDDEDDADTATT